MAAVVLLCALIAYGCEAMFHDVTHMMVGNLGLFFLAGSVFYEGYRRLEAAQPASEHYGRTPIVEGQPA
jgi:hypothetical protein